MRTDDLIAHLADEVTPVQGGGLARILLVAILLGLIGSAAVMLLVLHPRQDLADAMTSFGMWTKLAYTLALAAFALGIVERAGRPGAGMARPALLLALPVLAIALVSMIQM